MVNTLQFNLSVPTPYMFMRRFLKAVQSDKKVSQSFRVTERKGTNLNVYHCGNVE